MKKYGVENFRIDLIENCDNTSEREIYWIKEYDSYLGNGYNLTMGGDGVRILSKEEEQQIIDTYANTKSTHKTSKLLKVHRLTIVRVLKRNDVNFQLPPHTRPIVCVELKKEFESINQCARYIQTLFPHNQLKSIETGIGRSLRYNRPYNGYTFRYIGEEQ